MKLLNRAGHLTDESLLLMEDHELSTSASLAARQHLANCGQCRARQLWMRERLHEVSAQGAAPLTGAEAARERLQSALAASARASRRDEGRDHRKLMRSRFALPFAAAALVAVTLAWLAAHHLRPHRENAQEIVSEPDRSITPGAAHAVQLSELCRLRDDDLDPQVPTETMHQVFRAYHIDERGAAAYQVDYLINPQLGGSDQLENLWPQPNRSTEWNASAKDALETHLHAMVCHGEVQLETAQHDLATDWIAAYKKYFHVSRPLNTAAVALPNPLP